MSSVHSKFSVRFLYVGTLQTLLGGPLGILKQDDADLPSPSKLLRYIALSRARHFGTGTWEWIQVSINADSVNIHTDK